MALNIVDYDIRLARSSDVAALVELGRVSFARAYGDIVEVDDMKCYLSKMFAPKLIQAEIYDATATYVVAGNELEMLAYAKLVETAEPPAPLITGRLIELMRLYVRHGESGKGIGGALLATVMEKARADGYSGLWLRVWEKNEAAIRFYKKHGFHSLGVEPYLIGDTANPVVLMLKELT